MYKALGVNVNEMQEKCYTYLTICGSVGLIYYCIRGLLCLAMFMVHARFFFFNEHQSVIFLLRPYLNVHVVIKALSSVGAFLVVIDIVFIDIFFSKQIKHNTYTILKK